MRTALTRERVLARAVERADAEGVDALSMRTLAAELGVTPMALYKHVANKDDLLDAMIDDVVATFAAAPHPGPADDDWRARVRARVLAARAALLDHPWAPQVIESRTTASPVVLDHMNALMGDLLGGGLTADLTHHAMHVLGSRMWGFTQEVFPTPRVPDDPGERDAFLAAAGERYPHIMTISAAASHDSVTAIGCDDQAEFELALDLLVDGIERLHASGWSSTAA
ncbi:TetR/AcrR family transcriptional regulator [Georgenia sp. Z1344]|uniref:TetR/AcrR family transcriptional regulator n=1 Tax=Georgenia sp. Z1344 TaxID=3416706 RepID=UPI003CEF6C3E